MTGIEIRFAITEDCKALFTVIASVIQNISYYNDVAKKDETSKFQPHKLQTKIEEDKFSVILATHSSKIVGFCLSRFDDYLIWLEWFGILEDYRGKNISNLLLAALDKTINLRNCHKIWCDCRTSNSASIHILSSHGYNQLVTVANHWYNQDFILWEKRF